MSTFIAGVGSDLPARVLTNTDIGRIAKDYDPARAGMSIEEWTKGRNGTLTRHRLSPDEATSDIATRAAQRALDQAGLAASAVDLLVMATITPDYKGSPAAASVQKNLGIHTKFFELNHACTGFVDGVLVTRGLMDTVGYGTALLVCADATSTLLNPDQFMPQLVFGDGAGAVILQRTDAPYGLRAFDTGSNGHLGYYVYGEGGSRNPTKNYGVADFAKIFQFALEKFVLSIQATIARAGWELDDVDYFVLHQAGESLIVSVARQLEQPLEKFPMVVQWTGNTSSASIPITLDHVRRQGGLKDGQRIILSAVGSGMAWGTLALVWRETASSAPQLFSGEKPWTAPLPHG